MGPAQSSLSNLIKTLSPGREQRKIQSSLGEGGKKVRHAYEGINPATIDGLRVQAQSASRKAMSRGLLWLVCGVGASFLTYALSEPGQRYPAFWGTSILGTYYFLRGLYYFRNPLKLLDKAIQETADTDHDGVLSTHLNPAQGGHRSTFVGNRSSAETPREPAGSTPASGTGIMAALLARLSEGGEGGVLHPRDVSWTPATLAGSPSHLKHGVLGVHRMGVLWATQDGLISHPQDWASGDFLLEPSSVFSITVSPPDSVAWATERFLLVQVVAPGGNWLHVTNKQGRTFVFNDLPDDARTREVLQALDSLPPTN